MSRREIDRLGSQKTLKSLLGCGEKEFRCRAETRQPDDP